MGISLIHPRRMVTGLALVLAVAVCALLAAPASNAAPMDGTDGSQGREVASSGAGPDGDLELTRQQKAELDARATETLRNSKPGGKRIAPDKIAWDDGAVVLTLAIDGETRDDPNRDGHIHLYDGHHYNGDKLSLYKCRFEKLRWYDFTNKTSSWQNKQYGNTYANLYYWNNAVFHLRTLEAGGGMSWAIGNPNDNRADFARPCR